MPTASRLTACGVCIRVAAMATSAHTSAQAPAPGDGSGVAFVGLGDMGLPMAQNLLRAGYAVAGYDPVAKRRQLLRAAGGRAAKHCRDAARDAQVAFVMVMNGAQAMEALAGDDGLLRALRPGAVVVISATIEAYEAAALAAVAKRHRVRVVDAPVSGGLPGAQSGRLTFMVAGAATAVRKVRPHLRVLGAAIHPVGARVGDGQTVKAALQVMLGGMFVSIFEAFVLGKKAGVPDSVLRDVFTTSAGASPLLDNCAEKIVARRFRNSGSRIATMHKDLGISTNLARRVGAPAPVGALARELFQAGISSFPDEDNWCVVKVLERMAGLTDEPKPSNPRKKPAHRQ